MRSIYSNVLLSFSTIYDLTSSLHPLLPIRYGTKGQRVVRVVGKRKQQHTQADFEACMARYNADPAFWFDQAYRALSGSKKEKECLAMLRKLGVQVRFKYKRRGEND